MGTSTYADTMAQLEEATTWLRWCREKPHIWKDHERAGRLFERYIGLLSAKARRQWQEGQL